MPSNPVDLIASEHADKPKFRQLVANIGGAFASLNDMYLDIGVGFDLDNAIGDQLDQCGLWIGLSRQVRTPIEGVFFEWGDTDNPNKTGWGAGVWRGKFEQSSKLGTLPDDVYRNLLRVKAVSNRTLGTIESIAYAFKSYPDGEIKITDFQDMSISAKITGNLSDLQKELFRQEYVRIAPAGVKIRDITFESA